MDSQKQDRGRLPKAFVDQPDGVKVAAAIVAPALFGAVGGWLLGVSAVGYWIVQAVAAVGGFLAGLEHDGARAGALRGVLGGAIFGASILLVRAVTDRADQASLGSIPAALVVITAVFGSILGALGGRRRAMR